MPTLQSKLRPADLNGTSIPTTAFKSHLNRLAAQVFLTVAQRNGAWQSVPLRTLVGGRSVRGFMFEGLLHHHYITDEGDGVYAFTDAFVEECVLQG